MPDFFWSIMDYKKVTIVLPKGRCDDVSEFLSAKGLVDQVIQDYSDLIEATEEIFYDYIDEALLSEKDECPTISFFFEKSDDAESKAKEVYSLKAEIDEICAPERAVFQTEDIENFDWESNWKKYFLPFDVGERIHVSPTWVDEKTDDGKILLRIDPAGAFGSGTHATTKLCLTALCDAVNEGARVLDFGCGSGILAICALKLGASYTAAADIDRFAVDIARENFVQNGCDEGKYELHCANVLDDSQNSLIKGEFDIITANIVADVIKEARDYFFDKLKSGGLLIASGILEKRGEEVSLSLKEAGFNVLSNNCLDGWCSLICQKQA